MTAGDYTERGAVDIYERAGYVVETPTASGYGQGSEDYWNLFDGMGYRDGILRFWQAKTNQTRYLREWADDSAPLRAVEGVRVDYVVRHSGTGWMLYRPREDGYTPVVDERDMDCNLGDGVVEWLTHDHA